MKAIIHSVILLLITTLIAGAQADDKVQFNTKGIIKLVGEGKNLVFNADDGTTYYVYTPGVTKQLKPLAGKRVSLKGNAKKTKNGNRMHIVWVASVKPI